MTDRLSVCDLVSPVGPITVVASEAGLRRIVLGGVRWEPSWVAADMQAVEIAMSAYFTGSQQRFDLPLDPVGSDFDQQVWTALLDIPYGQTTTYGELAKRVGRPRGAQAVGGANGRNPLAIVVPCHRVIGKDGSLTGYAGGLDRKRALLELECAIQPGLFG